MLVDELELELGLMLELELELICLHFSQFEQEFVQKEELLKISFGEALVVQVDELE